MKPKREPIAIVGIGCRFPGAPDKDAFWELLRSGTSAVGKIPESRTTLRELDDPAVVGRDRLVSWQGGFIEHVAEFDWRAFRISPREAKNMDPQHRLVLEVAWEALEDAGIPFNVLAGTKTGVFVGIMWADYFALQAHQVTRVDGYGTTCHHSFAANRVSFFFDLKGPSLAIDVGCASSTTAVHYACQSLWSGESEAALVAGVNLLLTPTGSLALWRAGVLSHAGRCKTFDDDADGFVVGEGAGVIVLKPLDRAIADRDRIYAVISGSAVGTVGRSEWIMAPTSASQESLLRDAYVSADLDPSLVDYVELHGVGTRKGDPIEARALGAVLKTRPGDRAPCVVGSVKTNIGHLESAAGIASVIKVALSMYKKQIPASLNLKKLNSQISLKDLNLQVQTATGNWPRPEPWTAGVTSLSLGGGNAHIVLESFLLRQDQNGVGVESPDSLHVLPISARSPEALRDTIEKSSANLRDRKKGSLTDICWSAAMRRTHHEHRVALVARTADEMRQQMDAFISNEPRPGLAHGACNTMSRVVFVFPGQGGQWIGMGRELFNTVPVFRKTLEQCEHVFREYAPWSLLNLIQKGTEGDLAQIDVVQPTIFAIQLALAATWESWGIRPDVIVGHSMGEIAGARVAGGISLEDATRIIFRRSQLMKRLSGKGAMVTVELSLPEAQKLIIGREDKIAIGVSNSPSSTVLSGDPQVLQSVVSELQRRELFCKVIKVDVASHSPQLEPIRGELLESLRDLAPRFPKVTFCSTVADDEGQPTRSPSFDAEYWWKNLRRTVYFSQTVQQLCDSGHDTFLEISPHPILLAPLQQNAQAKRKKLVALPSIRRNEPERLNMLYSAAELHCRGGSLNWRAIIPEGQFTSLPQYQWQRELLWLDGEREISNTVGKSANPLAGHLLELARAGATHLWEGQLSRQTLEYMDDHRVYGDVVVTGASYIEMGLAAAAKALGSDRCVVNNVEFKRPLLLPETGSRTVQLVLTPNGDGEGAFYVYTIGRRVGEDKWTLNASGKIARNDAPPPHRLSIEQIRERCPVQLSGKEFYESLRPRGNDYGPCLQGIESIWRSSTEAIGRIKVPRSIAKDNDRYLFHPAILDFCLHLLAVLGNSNSAFMPSGMSSARVYSGPLNEMWSYAKIRKDTSGATVGDIKILGDDGSILADAEGLHLHYLDPGTEGLDATMRGWLYEYEWHPKDQPAHAIEPEVTDATWIIFADDRGVGAAFANLMRSKGHRCFVVRAGQEDKQISDSEYCVNVSGNESIENVIRALVQRSPGNAGGIVHLWNLDLPASEKLDIESLERAQITGTATVLRLVRAITSQTGPKPFRLWIGTDRSQNVKEDRINIAQTPVWGFGRSLALEHPNIWGGLVDLDCRFAIRDVALSLVRALTECRDEDQVAFRDGKMHVGRMVRLRKRERAKSIVWKPSGTYLITGGLGGLGLRAAEWAVQQGARTLALLGRRKLPPRSMWDDLPGDSPFKRQVGVLQKLEKQGAKVLVASVDVGNAVQLQSFLSSFQSEHGRIRGVIHAAGIGELLSISDMDVPTLLNGLRAKVNGSWLLHHLLRDLPLDFFVLYSSGASVLNSPRQAHYAAANAFLDGLAHYRTSIGLQAISINWGLWREDGMGELFGKGQNWLRAMGSFTADQGLTILEWLLRRDLAQAAVMPINWEEFQKSYLATSELPLLRQLIRKPDEFLAPVESRFEEPNLPGRLKEDVFTDPLAAVEQSVRRHVAAILRVSIKDIDPSRSIISLGFDSLMAVELRNAIEQEFGVTLPFVRFLEGSSVSRIASQLFERINKESGVKQ